MTTDKRCQRMHATRDSNGMSGFVMKDALASHQPAAFQYSSAHEVSKWAGSHGSPASPFTTFSPGNYVVTTSATGYAIAVLALPLRRRSVKSPQDHPATGSRAAQRAEWSCSGRCHAPYPPASSSGYFSPAASLPLHSRCSKQRHSQ